MASTNKTTNYELSQYVGSDKPTYLGDYNGDMLKIDTQMKVNATAAATADSKAVTAGDNASTALTNAAAAQNTADTASSTATNALSKATANETAITAIQTGLVYSTTEYNTGEKWIDGRTIYGKVIEYQPTQTIGESGKTTNINVPHSIADINYCIDCNVSAFYTGYNITGVMPHIIGNTNTTSVNGGSCANVVNDTNIIFRIINETFDTSVKFYFMLKYVKVPQN